ncbi:hypothetical protein ACOI1H_19165 [Loktanella sp. DJP18]|uniref:hypothetical protein n=1 Tax=Loktanella sp. DJP18 TaxID=3409788 RepID=UPI003BB48EE3
MPNANYMIKPGFHVAVRCATPECQIVIIRRNTPEGQVPHDRPIYWGTDEMSTLTPAESVVVEELLPAACRFDKKAKPREVFVQKPISPIPFALAAGAGALAVVIVQNVLTLI